MRTPLGRSKPDQIWVRCPKCWVDMGSPVLDDDHLRRCLFCGNHWQDPVPSSLPDGQRVPIGRGR